MNRKPRPDPRRTGRSLPSSPFPLRLSKGFTLIQLIGSFFVTGTVLGICVPLLLSGQRMADLSARRARLSETTREFGTHFREDVRESAAVQIANGGSELRLILPQAPPRTVRYRPVKGGLLRTAPGEELFLTGAAARFRREGEAVLASFGAVDHGGTRILAVKQECSAVPRCRP